MDILAESAVRVTVLALAVAAFLRALQVHSPRLAHRVWTAVVVVMLLLPVSVAWGPELAVPLLPAHASRGILVPAMDDVARAAPDTRPMTAASPTMEAQRRISGAAAAATIYFAGVGFFLLRLALGLRRAGAIRRGVVQAQGRLTHPACVTPFTVGVIAPVVVLPPDWASWDEAELSAVLAHEEEHVRRRDPLVAAVTLLNRAIFWFHPLAWWLPRKLSRLAEHACDAAVIARGHDREVYQSSLLRFARCVTAAGGRIAPMVVSMPGSGLQERLGRLARPDAAPAPPSRSRLASVAVTGAALALVCAAATPTAAPLQDVPSAPPGQAAWVVDTSEHFEIVHDGLPPDRVSDAVREAEAAYAQLSAALKYDTSRRVTIILVRRARDITAADVQARAPVLQGGNPARTRLVISLESLDRRSGIVVHELTHQFAFEIVPDTSRVAPFLIEGLAEHQRGAWNAEDLRLARAGAATGAIPSVADLASSDAYWAHAVFDFVAVQYGAEGVRQLMFALRAHETLERAAPVAFGLTLDRFDQAFRDYVTTRFGQP